MSVRAPQTPADPPKPPWLDKTTAESEEKEKFGFYPRPGLSPWLLQGEGEEESLPKALLTSPCSLGTQQGQVEVSTRGSWASQLPCSQSFVQFYSAQRQNKQVSDDFTCLGARICLPEKPPKATSFPFYLPLLSLLIFSGEK